MKKTALGMLFCLIALHPALAAELGLVFGWDAATTSSPKQSIYIGNIPPPLTSVPLHTGDCCVKSGMIDIRKDPSNSMWSAPHTLYATAFRFGPQVSFGNRLTLRGGMYYPFFNRELFRKDYFVREEFDYHGYDYTRSNFVEINLQGTRERGVGRSLVYMGTKVRPQWKPGFFTETELKLTRSLALVLGFKQYQHKLMINLGWDRYNSFESWKLERLGDIASQYPYAGLAFPFKQGRGALTVTVGPALFSGRLNQVAESSFLRTKNGIAFHISLSGHLRLF